MSLGPLEIFAILAALLLVFGGKRLPGLGRQLGTGMREFKDSISGKDDESAKTAAGDRQLPAAPADSALRDNVSVTPTVETVDAEVVDERSA